jgi:hypothetical protein
MTIAEFSVSSSFTYRSGKQARIDGSGLLSA